MNIDGSLETITTKKYTTSVISVPWIIQLWYQNSNNEDNFYSQFGIVVVHL